MSSSTKTKKNKPEQKKKAKLHKPSLEDKNDLAAALKAQAEIVPDPGNYTIARLAVHGKHYRENGMPKMNEIYKGLAAFANREHRKRHYEFLITPGGFLSFEIPAGLKINGIRSSDNPIPLQQMRACASEVIDEFFEKMPKPTLDKLKATCNFMTIGIDGRRAPDSKYIIEFVALYDLSIGEVIRWTGKSYPTKNQEEELIRIDDFDSHFIKVKNKTICMLGCHDLNVFSPRLKKLLKPGGWRKQIVDGFKSRFNAHGPSIILHHPHFTDSPRIWDTPWSYFRPSKGKPTKFIFASGIKYISLEENIRGSLQDILRKTSSPDTINFIC